MVAVLLASPAARAEDGDIDDEPDTAEDLTHEGQLGLNLQVSTGYRGIFPYDGEYCGVAGNNEACVERAPVVLDIGVSYGVTRSLELLLELTVGLEREFGSGPGLTGPRTRVYSPGLRYYFSETGQLRFFSTLQLAIDATDFAQASGVDYAIKNINGLQLDVQRAVGLYAFFGETVSWTRWLRFEMVAGLGVQARFP